MDQAYIGACLCFMKISKYTNALELIDKAIAIIEG